jgi:antitoxin HicB
MVARDRTFSVILEPQPEGGFTVLVPALPEIVTEGDTEEEALAMAEDAIRLVLEDRAARGEEIPRDSSTRIREVKVTIAA